MATKTTKLRLEYDTPELKEFMRQGKLWPSTLEAYGVDPGVLDGKGHPCVFPGCPDGPGDNRCSFPNRDDDGGMHCRHCHFEKNGDGIAALMRLHGWGYVETVNKVGELNNAPKKRSKSRSKKKPAWFDTVDNAIRDAEKWVQKDCPGAEVRHRWDYQNGAMHGCVVRWESNSVDPKSGKRRKAIRPFIIDNRGAWSCQAGDSPWPLLNEPAIREAPESVVVLVEGEVAADAVSEVGMLATTWRGGAKAIKGTDWSPLAGRTIVFGPDNDPAGAESVSLVAQQLATIEPRPKLLRFDWPGVPPGGDSVEWVQGLGPDADPQVVRGELQKLIDNAEPVDLAVQPKRVQIKLSTREDLVVAQTIDALANDPNVFVQDSRLVCVVEARDDKSRIAHEPTDAVLRELSKEYLRTRISAQAEFVKDNGQGLEPCHPPAWAVASVHSCGAWRNPSIAGVTACPFITPSGRIVSQAGFDNETGVYLKRSTDVSVPVQCTRGDARRAMELLYDPFLDFPFAEPYHGAALLALALTLPARESFTGPIPGYPIDANVRGSGKSLLASAIYGIWTGERLAIQTECESQEEWSKIITALAIEGATVVCLDNADRAVGSRHLDAALTSTRWKSRLLGSSQTIDVPFRPVWMLTGNNLKYRGDTMRRIVPIRLQSPEEHPEERHEFKYPHLLEHVCRRHPELVSAALVILRAFQQAGAPQADLTPFGSYEGWSSVVRQATYWISGVDPCEGARLAAREGDPVRDALAAIFNGWLTIDPSESGVTAAEAFKAVSNDVELLSDFGTLCRCPPSKIDGNKIGNAFRDYTGRVVDGQAIEKAGTIRGRAVWMRVSK